MNKLDRQTQTRGFKLFAVGLLATVGVGFFAGTRDSSNALQGYGAQAKPETASERAPSYAQLREESGRNELYTASVALLRQKLPKLTDPVVRPPESRALALNERANNRAFDGAPPTIPHAVDPRQKPNCVVCHEQGVKIGDRIAPAMSHKAFASCTQCHATSSPAGPLQEVTLADVASNFEPLPFGGLGPRAWDGSPPELPHDTHMRENCSSCHGVTGALGLRSTHPARQNCQQCHALNASLEQRPFLTQLGADQ